MQTRTSVMTRRAVLVGAGLAGAALAACQTAGGNGPATASSQEVTISYVTDWAGPGRGDWIDAAIPKFSAENPKIKVRVDNWGGEVTVVAAANAAAGTLQDVFLGSNDVYIQLVQGGQMQDITPVLKQLRVNMNDVVHFPSTIIYKGKQYGMPFQMAGQIMMINKTLFKQNGAPLPDDKTTYPQLLESLRRIARPSEGTYGMRVGGNPGSWGQWLPFVWGYGGERWSTDHKKTLLDQPGAVEGLQFYVDMMYRDQVAVPIDEKGGFPAGTDFNSGKVAIAFAANPGAAQDKAVGGKFEWDIMYHPIGPKTNKRNVFFNDQANTVSGGAAKRGVLAQAVQFVVWTATSKTAQDLIVQIGPGAMPVSKAVLNSAAYLAGPPASQKNVVDMIPGFRDPDVFIGWNQWRDDVWAKLAPAFANKKPVRDAAADAVRAGDLVLAKIPA